MQTATQKDGKGNHPRTLSKSDFILARTCDAKLFFRENRYPDSGDDDPYLELLGEGGYMVEALAKAQYAEGIQLQYGGNVADEFACTVEYLRRDRVTLFEATLLVGRRQARVDILQKTGNLVRLLEVKAKSFNGAEHAQSVSEGKAGVFRAGKKPYTVLATWQEKLEDVTFQMLLLEKVLPGCVIKPYLVLVDTSKQAAIDNIPTLFALERRLTSDGTTRVYSARYVGTAEQLVALDLVTEVDVSAEVTMLRSEVEEAATRFEALLDAPLSTHTRALERGSKCVHCEFRIERSEQKNGFADCWGPLATPHPHVLELFSVGTVKTPDSTSLVQWMVDHGKASLLEIPEKFLVKKDGSIGSNAERQRRQIEQTRRGEVFIGPKLSAKIEALNNAGRLHFIDFETSRLALPYHRRMRPYGLVTFQWSCHTLDSLGAQPAHMEWLNDRDVWPNQSFAESLRQAIGDSGPVLTWSHFEATTLRHIVADLATFGRNVPQLVAWMTDVFERRIVDLHEWARLDFYNPGMRGRTSIKVVLEALWKCDEVMRQQFEAWTGYKAYKSRDPYVALPSVEINGIMQDVHEGTGAMRAYQEMMYGSDKHDGSIRAKWSALLRQYCALDTLSMVLILEHWRRLVYGSDVGSRCRGLTISLDDWQQLRRDPSKPASTGGGRMADQVPFEGVTFAENAEPRCPCVLVLDVSGSMAGQPISELNSGLTQYKDELVADSLAAKRVDVAVVTFGGHVQTACEFATANSFFPPNLSAGGDTPLGQAVHRALDLLQQRKESYKQNGIGHYRPWVFLITDGAPTDEWQSAAERVKQGDSSRSFMFFAVGVEGANMEILKQISPPNREPLKLKGLRFRDLFGWLSNSQKAVSHSRTSDTPPLTNPTEGPKGWAVAG